VTTTILTVDDSRTMREILRSTLASEGYDVLQAEDGMDGLAMLEARTPDIIITDINMPRLDGFGFIKEVRRDLRHRATPILVLSTELDGVKKQRARDEGATGWIVKPFSPPKLLAVLRRVSG
jgi:two-component system chemotaxis response regulator CheY